jgi:RNA polymerase sigma-70 factor, ECF subfamily
MEAMQTKTYLLSSKPAPLDKNTLADLYERHSPGLFRYAVRLLGDNDLAEECVAETFSRLLQAVQKGSGPREHVQAYLYRIAHNWITDFYRTRPADESLNYEIQDDRQENPAAIAASNDEQEKVRRALLQLSYEQRQVIMLRFFEDWPHHEVADLLGKTPEATRAIQSRALAMLRALLVEGEVK